NPRYRFQYDSLANCSFRPLRHLTGFAPANVIQKNEFWKPYAAKKQFLATLVRYAPNRRIRFRRSRVLTGIVIDAYVVDAFQHLLEYFTDRRDVFQRDVAVDELFLVHLRPDDFVDQVIETLSGRFF